MSAQLKGAVVAALLASAACGPAPSTSGPTSGLSVARPQALIDCASPPGEALQARLWVSGHNAPCALDVADDGATGDCVVTPGIERRVTIDWFVDRGGVVILLAQASTDVDLAGASDDVVITFTDADYITEDCLDMSVDSFAGRPTVEVFNVQQPVCDLDDDGQSNVVETCAGTDPLGAV